MQQQQKKPCNAASLRNSVYLFLDATPTVPTLGILAGAVTAAIVVTLVLATVLVTLLAVLAARRRARKKPIGHTLASEDRSKRHDSINTGENQEHVKSKNRCKSISSSHYSKLITQEDRLKMAARIKEQRITVTM